MPDTDTDWKKWGRRDPYFGVLSDQRFRRVSIDEHLDEFFDSGTTFIRRRLSAAEHHLDFNSGEAALDFGCGVGRLTLPLARRFNRVTAVDISPGMLAEAQRNAKAHDIVNIEFVESDDALSKVKGCFDFINSYIVLQHIPVARGMTIIDRLLDLVLPGGVAALHVSVERRETASQRLTYLAQRDLPPIRPIVNVLRRRPFSEPFMQMNKYSLVAILDMAAQKGFGPCLIEPENHGRVLTANLLCRRSAAN